MIEKYLNNTREISYSILPSLLHDTHWHQINEMPPLFLWLHKQKELGFYFVLIKMKLYSAYLISIPQNHSQIAFHISTQLHSIPNYVL